jgi:hypothetical protein
VTTRGFAELLILTVLIVIAAACLGWPRPVQRVAIRALSWPSWLARYNPGWASEFVRSPIYLVHLRLVGILAAAVAAFLIFSA